MDLDIEPDEAKNDGKKYRSLEEAIAAVFVFCRELGIPNPSVIIRSGGGIHCYWFSDVALKIAEWDAFAKGLKAAALAWGLKADLAVTADITRVLRLPIEGAKNYKYKPPREVRFERQYSLGAKHNFAVAFAKLASGTFVSDGSVIDDEFGAGLQGEPLPPIPFSAVAKECAWLRSARCSSFCGASSSTLSYMASAADPSGSSVMRCLAPSSGQKRSTVSATSRCNKDRASLVSGP